MIATPLYARRRPLLAAGDSATRLREYRETIVWLGSMGIATLLTWVAMDRPLAALGFTVPDSGRALSGIAAAMGIAVFLFVQVRTVRGDARAREAVRSALDSVREFLPATTRETRLFRGVALSAGVGEEIFFRGFLLWYLTALLSLPWAIAISSISFGLVHIMHGAGATVRAAITGAVLAGLYIWSGSLWAPMLLHTAIDLSSGSMGIAVYGERAAEA